MSTLEALTYFAGSWLSGYLLGSLILWLRRILEIATD